MTTSGGVVIDVGGLRMRYGASDVLRDVAFQARHGEVLVLLGPNGAGKTTTIEILEGFRMRSADHVEVLGADPAHGDERWRARRGIVLQSWRDHPKWRVRELLAHLGSYADHRRRDRRGARPADRGRGRGALDPRRAAVRTPTSDATRFVFGLFRQYGETIAELEVRRASLEDTYLALVRQAEAGQVHAAAGNLERNLEEVA